VLTRGENGLGFAGEKGAGVEDLHHLPIIGSLIDDPRLPMLISPGIGAAFLILVLATGRTFNPARGTSPMIVSRRDQPVSYWLGVILLVLFFAVASWIAYAAFTS
jgi:hypothetical protein